MESFLVDPLHAVPFVIALARHRELLADLNPKKLEEILQSAGERSQEITARRRYYVTVSPPPFSTDRTIYAGLYRAIKSATPAAMGGERETFLNDFLARSPGNLICNADGGSVRPIESWSCDGVVNASLQFDEDKGKQEELAAVVVADHLDVVGHYPKNGGNPKALGLLASGAHFRDAECAELYNRIGDDILQSIPLRRRPSQAPPAELKVAH